MFSEYGWAMPLMNESGLSMTGGCKTFLLEH